MDSDFQGVDPNQDESIVLTVEIENFVVKEILTYHGSSMNILY